MYGCIEGESSKTDQDQCQIIDLHKSSSSLEWAKKYLKIDTSSQDGQLTPYQFILIVSSYLVYPLASPTAAEHISGSSLDGSVYPTWILSSTELLAVLDSLWELLDPETENHWKCGIVTCYPKCSIATIPRF